MRVISFLTILTFFVIQSNAQSGGVSINSNGAAPDPSAALDVNYSDRGLLIPRMTAAQRDAIVLPAKGLQIYNLDCEHINFNAGTPESPSWESINSSNSVIAGVSITADPAGSVCQGTSVTYTASIANGGSAPTYQWNINGVDFEISTNSSHTSLVLFEGEVVFCRITSNAPCVTGSPATSNTLTVQVNPSSEASVNIVSSASESICAGTIVTFTATPVNGGTSPTYQWKNGGNIIPGAINSTYTTNTLSGSDDITCVMTSNLPCVTGSPATSNNIITTVNPVLAASVTIAVSPSATGCTGGSFTFTATPVNGGSSPSYQWRKNGLDISGQTNATYTTSSLSTNDAITCVLTSNLACVTGSPATSNIITVTLQNGSGGTQTYSATGSGSSGTIQTFTVPTCITSLTIEAWGAQGGNSGGLGARMKGTFAVTPGQVLKVLVGQAGQGGSNEGGGGGGTFVVNSADNSPLIIAGGGGGNYSGSYSGRNAVTTTTGQNSQGAGTTSNGGIWQDNGYGGSSGNGGASGTYGSSGGGGGLLTDGANGVNTTASVSALNGGGKSFLNGGSGGTGCSTGHGGFGGGGGSACNGHSSAGGGGYSGGGGASWTNTGYNGGGGGSYNAGTNQSNTAGVQSGHGQVVFTW